MCKQCNKQFLYIASLKKHLQNLHPDIFEQLNNGNNLEQYCTVMQKPAAKTVGSQPTKTGEDKKLPGEIPVAEAPPENKEETKRPAPVPAPKEEPIPVPQKPIPDVGALLNPYYASSIRPPQQMQPEVFQMAYNNPFLYSQQNYGLLCMLQAAKQSESLRQSSDFWMHKLASPQNSLPIAGLSRPVASNEAAAAPSPQVSYGERPEPQVEEHEARQEPGITASLAAKIRSLPVEPVQPLAQSEHHHIHCEFCGHSTIRHNGHIDYVHDAELHHVSSSGCPPR